MVASQRRLPSQCQFVAGSKQRRLKVSGLPPSVTMKVVAASRAGRLAENAAAEGSTQRSTHHRLHYQHQHLCSSSSPTLRVIRWILLHAAGSTEGSLRTPTGGLASRWGLGSAGVAVPPCLGGLALPRIGLPFARVGLKPARLEGDSGEAAPDSKRASAAWQLLQSSAVAAIASSFDSSEGAHLSTIASTSARDRNPSPFWSQI
jgi:hypothetical protein